MKDSVARFTLTLPRATKDLVERLADREGISASSMMQRLLEAGLTIEAIRMEGGELIATLADGRQVVIAGKRGRFTFDSRRMNKLLGDTGEEP